MKRETLEITVGAVVVALAFVFILFAYSARIGEASGYALFAQFHKVDGIVAGDDVRLGGVRIGTVVEQRLDPENFSAVLELQIQPRYQLPVDTRATINGDGLIGGKYVKIEPGQSDEVLQAGATITDTRDVIELEKLVREIINLAVSNPGEDASSQEEAK